MRQLATYLIPVLMLGCATKSGGTASTPVVGITSPPPPPPIVEAAPPPPPAPAYKILDSTTEPAEARPVRVVYVERSGRARAATPAPTSAPAMSVGMCATCPDCPACAPVVNVNPPAPEKEGPWGFIAAAFGGAASVLAAAFAKKFLGVSAS